MAPFADPLFEEAAARGAALRAAFLRDPLLRAAPLAAPPGGILYAEDFEAPAPAPEPEPAPDPDPPPISAADLQAARDAAYQEGFGAALREQDETEAQLRRAAAQTIADAFSAWHGRAAESAAAEAAAVAATMLAVLHAALPATMARYGAWEAESVARALLPLLRHAPRLRIRAHPEHLRDLQRCAAELLPARGLAPVPEMIWDADPGCAAGDLELDWAEGSARRDTAEIQAAIATALAPLTLPPQPEQRHAE